ncbi:ras-related protein Rab-32-like [Lingula anatina]|uniref:Ras-related protein Rab-32-like n=1 Tax=Lingula anatina TaxID=7574 RepID=A0A1S3J511_LINAN|nr:ras-related protein Rab-32-like [Lingula anatina]|eukprot:XP_013404929.1 ras-related protein Rab-32-like [Lingula anatina]
MAAAEKKEHLYKILVIGELGTGKTSIIKRYVHQFFSQHYRATVSFYHDAHWMCHLRQMDEYCKDKAFAGWFETSAKENINIDEAARFLVTKILANEEHMQTNEDGPKDSITITSSSSSMPGEKKSCC